MKTMHYMAAALILAALPAMAPARTKLVTLPDRAKIVMSLDNPRFALLYEEREIPLQKGTNFIDFSWTGVTIDQNSVMIEMLSHPGDGAEATKIIATGFPPNENALTWQVSSPEARTERIRVSYLLYGITQESSYEFRVNEEETQGDFRQYLLLRNGSGEDLDDTIVRVPLMDDLTRSVDSGEVRRFLAARRPELPFQKLYVARTGYSTFKGEDGEEISLVYELTNDTASGLGTYKLPSGKVRLFGDDGMDSSIFLGEDVLRQTPPREKGELTLGKVKDVVLRRYLATDERVNIKYDTNRRPTLFDIDRVLRYEVENFKDEPVTLKIHEALYGEWVVDEVTEEGVRWERKSAEELILYIDLPAREEGSEAEKREIILDLTLKNRFPNER